jgi:hypothetical protein
MILCWEVTLYGVGVSPCVYKFSLAPIYNFRLPQVKTLESLVTADKLTSKLHIYSVLREDLSLLVM